MIETFNSKLFVFRFYDNKSTESGRPNMNMFLNQVVKEKNIEKGVYINNKRKLEISRKK